MNYRKVVLASTNVFYFFVYFCSMHHLNNSRYFYTHVIAVLHNVGKQKMISRDLVRNKMQTLYWQYNSVIHKNKWRTHMYDIKVWSVNLIICPNVYIVCLHSS